MAVATFGFLPPGARFLDRYEVVRGIKAGAMGAVHEVLDTRTAAPRALKVMLPSIVEDPDLRVRFEREARVTGAIESDHLVKVFDAGVDDATGMPFLVMELLRGEDLGAPLRRGETLGYPLVVTYLAQVARALDKTHAAGIVHRDLKPDNLFLARRDDGSPSVKILDFGIAKVLAEGGAGASRQLGTPLYMSPEQIGGDAIDGRSDLYALAHIAYTLLVGEAYWRQEARASEATVALFERMRQGPGEPPVQRAARRRGVALPRGFDAWFARAAAADPARRFATAFEQISALAEVLGLATPRAQSGDLSGPSGVLAVSADRFAAASAADETTTGVASPAPREARGGARVLFFGAALLAGVAAAVLLFARTRQPSDVSAGATTAETAAAPASFQSASATAAPPAPSASEVAVVPSADRAAGQPSTSPSARPPPAGTRGAPRGAPTRRQMF